MLKSYRKILFAWNLGAMSGSWNLTQINAKRCTFLKKNDYSSPQYHLCGNQLKAVSEVKDLGICITSNLSWSMQANKCAKLIRQIVCLDSLGERWVLKILSCFQNFIRVWYVRYSSTTLQFGVRTLKKTLNTLEKVQRRASKCTLGNVGQDMPYEERLKLLKWPSLERRRLFPSLIEIGRASCRERV